MLNRLSWHAALLFVLSVISVVFSLLSNGDTAVLIAFLTYCLFLWFVILILPRQSRFSPLVSVAFIALILTYGMRLLGLSIYNYSFSLSGPLVISTALVLPIFLGTFAILLGLSFPSNPYNAASTPLFTISIPKLKLLSCVNILTIVVFGYFRLTQRVGFDEQATSSQGFITRFLPLDAFAYVSIFSLVVAYSSGSLRDRRSICFSTVPPLILYLLVNIISGGRGILFQVLFYVLFSMLSLRCFPGYLSRKMCTKVVFASAIVAFSFPVLISIAMYYRDVTRLQDSTVFTLVSPTFLLALVTERYAGPDVLQLVDQIPTPEALNLQNILLSIVNSLIPDFVLPESLQTAIPIGKIFGVYYQNLPEDLAHHGSFYGIGLFYSLFPLIYPFALFGFASSVRYFFNLSSRHASLMPASSFFFLSLVLGFVSSANFDSILSVLVPQSILLGLFLCLANPFRQLR